MVQVVPQSSLDVCGVCWCSSGCRCVLPLRSMTTGEAAALQLFSARLQGHSWLLSTFTTDVVASQKLDTPEPATCTATLWPLVLAVPWSSRRLIS